MAAYNIYEAKTGFSALVEKAVNGEEVIIAKAGKPLLKLVPVIQPQVAPVPDPEPRCYRKAPGSVDGHWDDLLAELDKPWPEDIQRAFGMID